MALGGRRGARRLLLQALYQHQMSGHDGAELLQQFAARPEYAAADGAYFEQILGEVIGSTDSLDESFAEFSEIPPGQLDPVDRAVLWIAAAEISGHPEVPSPVIVNEAVELARQFGAEDGHRYVNAVLDRLATAARD